jgi:hypothetical protein
MAEWHNLRSINALRDRFEAEVAEVTSNPDLTQAAKAARARELAAGFQRAYEAEKAELTEAMEQHHRTLTRKAYPAERVGNDVQRELLEEMRGQRIEREIHAQAEGGGFDPVEALKEARYRNDTARQVVIERVGKRYLPQDSAYHTEFARLVEEARRERMTPAQLSALEQLGAFEHQQGEISQALGLVDSIVQKRLRGVSAMSAPEDRRGLANLAAGAGAGGQLGQGR